MQQFWAVGMRRFGARCAGALDLNSNSVFARYLGESFGFAGDYEAALRYCNAAIPSASPLIVRHLVKHWAAFMSESYQEGVQFAMEAGAPNPEFSNI
jgi:hypothetical protein